MYTVKKFKKNEIIIEDAISPSTCFAVIDHEGNVVISSKHDVEIYWRESSAQQVADWYNSSDLAFFTCRSVRGYRKSWNSN